MTTNDFLKALIFEKPAKTYTADEMKNIDAALVELLKLYFQQDRFGLKDLNLYWYSQSFKDLTEDGKVNTLRSGKLNENLKKGISIFTSIALKAATEDEVKSYLGSFQENTYGEDVMEYNSQLEAVGLSYILLMIQGRLISERGGAGSKDIYCPAAWNSKATVMKFRDQLEAFWCLKNMEKAPYSWIREFPANDLEPYWKSRISLGGAGTRMTSALLEARLMERDLHKDSECADMEPGHGKIILSLEELAKREYCYEMHPLFKTTLSIQLFGSINKSIEGLLYKYCSKKKLEQWTSGTGGQKILHRMPDDYTPKASISDTEALINAFTGTPVFPKS